MPSTSVRVLKKAGFQLPTAGLHIGTLVAVTDLGLITPKNPKWKPREKVRLEFALDELGKDNRPIILRDEVTKSLWEAATLSEYVDALVADGTVAAVPEGSEIELVDLVGRSLQLWIKHHVSNGKTFANVDSRAPLAPGQVGVNTPSSQPAVVTAPVQPVATAPLELLPAQAPAATAPLFKLSTASASTTTPGYVIGQPTNGATK